MKSDKLRPAYRNFFLKSEEGQHFVKALEELIDGFHQQAEKNASEARDYTQQARGVRQVLNHIQTNLVELKKS